MKKLLACLLVIGGLTAAPDAPVHYVLVLPEEWIVSRMQSEMFYAALFRASGDIDAQRHFEARAEVFQEELDLLQTVKPKS